MQLQGYIVKIVGLSIKAFNTSGCVKKSYSSLEHYLEENVGGQSWLVINQHS